MIPREQSEENVEELDKRASYRLEHNPFEYDSPVTKWELFKMVFFTCTFLAPLRALTFALLVVLGAFVAILATLGLDNETLETKPLPTWRRAMLYPCKLFARVALFVLGFYRVKVNGKPSPHAAFVTPNHVSIYDGLIFVYLILPAFLVKAEATSIPIMGRLLRCFQCVKVQRESLEARLKTRENIQRYAESQFLPKESPRFPPLVIFPQGTTTDNNYVTMFHTGAFIAGLPVQPVAIKYKYTHFNPAYLVNRKNEYYMLRCLSQFSQSLEVTFLPVCTPTEAEKANPQLFANRVKHQIAAVLRAQETNHCYEDAKLYRCGLDIKEKQFPPRLLVPLPREARVHLHGFQMKEVKDLFQHDKSVKAITYARACMKIFCKYDRNNDGFIDMTEFCESASLDPKAKRSERLFAFYDRNDNGLIDFREFIMGVARSSSKVDSSDKLRFCFDLLDTDDNGLVSVAEVEALLHGNLPANEEKAQVLRFKSVMSDQTKDGGLTWRQFEHCFQHDDLFVKATIDATKHLLQWDVSASS